MAAYREASSASPPILVAASNGSVFGLDTSSGERRWTHRLGERGVRLYVSDTFVLALGATSLTRLSYPDGTLDWEASVPFVADAILVREDGIFVAGVGEIACLALASGELRWRNEMKGEGVGKVALALPFDAVQVDSF